MKIVGCSRRAFVSLWPSQAGCWRVSGESILAPTSPALTFPPVRSMDATRGPFSDGSKLDMRNFKKPTTHDAHKNSEMEEKRANGHTAAAATGTT